MSEQEEHITLDKVIGEEIKEDVKETPQPVEAPVVTEAPATEVSKEEFKDEAAPPAPEEKPPEEKPVEEKPKKGEISIQWDNISYVVFTRDSIYIIEKGATEDEPEMVNANVIVEKLKEMKASAEVKTENFSQPVPDPKPEPTITKKSKDSGDYSGEPNFARMLVKNKR